MLFTRLRQVPSRQLLVQVLYSLSTIASMVMLYTGLGILSNSESPVVVVLSGSMEPAFKRGDILFLTDPIERTYKPGDIIVYKIPGSPIPIVHRVLEIHEHYPTKSLSPEVAPRSYSSKPYFAQPDNERFQLMLTKGDNNPVDDIELYNGLEWIQPKHVIGKVQGFLPYVGYISIAMNDAPKLKYIIFAVLSIFSLL